jgi:hypothetical protein
MEPVIANGDNCFLLLCLCFTSVYRSPPVSHMVHHYSSIHKRRSTHWSQEPVGAAEAMLRLWGGTRDSSGLEVEVGDGGD